MAGSAVWALGGALARAAGGEIIVAMKTAWILLFAGCCAASWAQAPAQDSRNTQTPNTDTHFTLRTFASRAEWEQHKTALRKQILTAAGLYPMPARPAPHAEVFGREQRRSCTIEKVLIETMPGYYLGGNLYRPLNDAGKHPAVLNPHGHWTYGRLENQPLDSGPEFGMNLAKQGYVVFLWDMVGYNDTAQTAHAFGGPAEELWGFGPYGLQFWNALRAFDFVSALPDVDAERIAMAGASGGGTQTMGLAAVEDRLAFAAPVSMVSAMMQGGDVCENAPGLRVATNNVEFASMMAPKPMLLVANSGDWTRNTATEEYPAIKTVYALYDKAANVSMVHLDAPHNFNKENREAVYRFLAQHALGITPGRESAETNEPVDMLQGMLALWGRTPPANSVNYAGAYADWRKMAEAARAQASVADLRERLALALGVEWPAKVSEWSDGESLILSRPGAGDRVPGIWLNGKGIPILVVHKDGAEAARKSAAVEVLHKAGRPVLMIDAFQTGSAIAPRDRKVKNFATFNRTDDQCRVQDILTALAYLQQKGATTLEVVTVGKAGIWAEFAAAAAPVNVRVQRDNMEFHGSDEEFLRDFPVPDIQRAGGWWAAEKVLGR